MMTNIITILSVLISVCTLIGFLCKTFKKLNALILKTNEYKNTQEQRLNDLSESISENYIKLDEKVNSISDVMLENRLAILRVELNQMIASEPENHDTICRLFDEYKSIGGNKYMDLKFNKWKHQQNLGN